MGKKSGRERKRAKCNEEGKKEGGKEGGRERKKAVNSRDGKMEVY